MKLSHVLDPAMPPQARPTWSKARWIGLIDLDNCASDADGGMEFVARHADGYHHARVLVRHQGQPVAFVEVPVRDALIRLPACPLPEDLDAGQPARLMPISVVLCTRDRPDQLADALKSILSLDYPEFEVVVVDNAARTDATAGVVAQLGDARVRRVAEPIPGLSTARNTGLRHAAHPVVAFTDDDVVVDRQWLRGLARGFARAPRVTCVAGLIPSGELRTPAQAYFDQRVSWAGSLRPRLFSMAEPPEDLPLFPFQVGRIGAGANFAVNRDRIVGIGGFDEALGAGTAAQGGEDLDLFFRVVTAGDTIAAEPSAIVWHRHRSDNEALLSQVRGYGVGLGAWLTKVGMEHSNRRLAMRVLRRRFRSSLRAGADYGAIMAMPSSLPNFRDDLPSSVGRTEVLAVLAGPKALWRGRRSISGRVPSTVLR
ncbi:glycosyltransferase [Mycolicibacterium austroafricanum]|nr:glycosyltransferase [Mycolicibacterium austroafricanum]QZT71008.1 glycosyltransferase [Mycolicibacterium austroafricanum]